MNENDFTDKSTWGEGPWQTEPDHVDFEHAGLPCILHRNRAGVWCGYVAVSPEHPAHGKDYDSVAVKVHGGLTYSNACYGKICHVPKPGKPDNVWWLGFDCAHLYDLVPMCVATMNSIYEAQGKSIPERDDEIYRDLAYVRAETEKLAEQLAEMATTST